MKIKYSTEISWVRITGQKIIGQKDYMNSPFINQDSQLLTTQFTLAALCGIEFIKGC